MPNLEVFKQLDEMVLDVVYQTVKRQPTVEEYKAFCGMLCAMVEAEISGKEECVFELTPPLCAVIGEHIIKNYLDGDQIRIPTKDFLKRREIA